MVRGEDLEDARAVIKALEAALVGTTQDQWARRHGLSQSIVSAVKCGTEFPSERIAAALGFERVTLFRRLRR